MEKKFYKLSFLVFFMVFISMYSFFFSGVIRYSTEKDTKPIPKVSAFGTIAPIWITDDGSGASETWAEVAANPWCIGNGSINNPYTIENITINGGGVDNCIRIEDTNDHFIIRNCTLVYSGDILTANAGISLYNVGNGTIDNNKFYDHLKYALILETLCSDIKIQHNYIKNTTTGIRYYDRCNNTLIYNNTILDTSSTGIYINQYSNENTIFNNTIKNSQRGMYLNDGLSNIKIDRNIIYNMSQNGLYFGAGVNYFNVTRNQIYNCSNTAFVCQGSGHNIFLNYFYNNSVNAFEGGSSNSWDNGSIGNYWDDYEGKDIDDDGIGDDYYLVPSSGTIYDTKPIWDDRARINILSPSNYTNYYYPPLVEIDCWATLGVNTTWYQILGSGNNHTFEGDTVLVNDTDWIGRPDGIVSIIFYVNDTRNNLDYTYLNLQKDTLPPEIIVTPPDLIIGEGYSGVSISWIATDINPYNYTIELLGSRFVVNSTSWSSGIIITYDIPDDLLAGNYFYSINFTDDYGNYANHTLRIIIASVITLDTTDPVITSTPTNSTLEQGYSGESLSWTATDLNPGNYTIELQGSGFVVNSTSWLSDVAITYDIPDGLSVGEYIYIINFTDTNGNSETHSITVTIQGTEGNGGSISFGNYFIVFIIFGIISILIYNKKRFHLF